MDNPLQEIAGGFTFARMKRLIAFFIALLPVTMLAPLASVASTSCSNGFCTQTFYFTGSPQEFNVPDGVTTIRFEVSGASGSRGGAGGRVSGSLTNLPERLIIEVGQAGTFGSNRDGGYNGGGSSGGSRGNEGSGGGASDIRLGADLQSRIVVAGGGGGGGGGGASSIGAPGGGLIAEAGTSGQGTAGLGGTQEQGGLPGATNGSGQQPSEGSFGQGGSGGSGAVGGGGGGGGGWYGGGGGGGDDTSGSGDGGGGGGGSSYTSPNYASNVAHQVGAQWGHGRIHIHYQLPTQVISFSGQQAAYGQIKYQILFDQSAQDLNPDDFSYDRADCSIWRIALNDNHAEVTLSGCGGDSVTLTLKANAVGLETFGPSESVSATVFLDRAGPSFEWSQSTLVTSASDVAMEFSLSDSVIADPTHFEAMGCELAVESSTVLLSSCSEGVNQVSFKAQSVLDSWGNLGPSTARTLLVYVDRTAPTVTWSDVVVSGEGPFTYSTRVSFSEAVQWSSSAVSFSSNVACETGSSGMEFWAVCDYADLSWSFDASMIQDQALNSGLGLFTRSISHTRPLPPEPTRSQVVAPAAPAEPEPVSQPAVDPTPSGPPIVVVPVVTPEPEPVVVTESQPVTATESDVLPDLDFLVPSAEMVGGIVRVESDVRPRAAVAAIPTLPVAVLATSSEQVSTEPSSQDLDLTQYPETQADLAAGPEVEFEPQPEFPWLMIFAAGAVALMGVGIWRFSGR